MYPLTTRRDTQLRQSFASTTLLAKRSSTATLPAEPISPQLAKLSHRPKWILFTAECPRPKATRLQQLNFTTKHVVQMQASRQLSEKELVLKALQAGTASAIVASSAISAIDQKHLQQRGKQLGCEVFFVDASCELYLTSASKRFH